MNLEVKPLAAITEEALRALCKEIGVVNTIRFLNQFNPGYGNYTEEREQMFEGLTIGDIVSRIKQAQKKEDAL